MTQGNKIRAALTAILLFLVVGSPALAVDEPQQIPAHPSDLEYGPLDFEVPDASEYRHELKNGIPVYIAEDHDLPLIEVSITLRAGAFLDPADKPGLADSAGRMLRRGGAGSMTAEEFDERLEFLAADMGSFGGNLSSGASFNCISGVFDEALGLFFQMLKSPRFQEDRIRVERDNILEELKQRNDSPVSISSREWAWLMRGHDSFLSHAITEQELSNLTRDDLADFHQKYWRPENMILAVSGDVNPAAVLAKLNEQFSGWDAKGPKVPWPPSRPDHDPEPGVYYVNKDIPQGRVLIGHVGYLRKNWKDPEVFSLAIMNDILGGGGFTSRVVKRIRSDEGLAYSAGSSFGTGQYWPGVFQTFYQSKSETVAFAAQIALEEIERIRTEAVTEEELTVARNSFIDVFPRRWESASQIVDIFADDEFNGRPHAYWEAYQDNLRAVKAEDVLRVAKKHLHPDKLVLLIVGDWKAVEVGDVDGKASMALFYDGKATELPLRDPLTLKPIE